MSTSVKKRFAVSFASNALRSGLSFLAGLVVARGLGPVDYGRLMFLLGSFVSIKSLLDLGTSNAFYTFISQARRPLRYYLFYLLWLAVQFLLTVAAVGVLLPDAVVRQMWVGESRGIILLAFAASFFQQQLWQTVNQIAEASRRTVRVQALNLTLAAVYLAGAGALAHFSSLSVKSVLFLLVGQYLVMAAASLRVLGPRERDSENGHESMAEMLKKYRDYCAPLAVLSAVTFLYDFADKWMLQRFGGALQQGLYQVSYQFAIVSVLATSSILNIFWKEMAEAIAKKDAARVGSLFRKVSKGLYLFGTAVSGFLIPWSGEIVRCLLGAEYASAGPVLALMLVYPLHQSLGQVSATALLAGEKTRQYFNVSLVMMLVSLPVSYLLIAPASAAVPGLGLGAMGMAVKMVMLNVISVNLMIWSISRSYGWEFEFAYQFVVLGGMLALGAALKALSVGLLGALGLAADIYLAPAFIATGAVYLGCVISLVMSMPGLAGLEKAELESYLQKLRARSR